MTFSFSDPLFLLSAQTGLTQEELLEKQAEGNQKPESPLQAVQLGEPIPVVFCRRRTVDDKTHGGVYIAPKATEGRFTNTVPDNALSFAYLLVLSEGELPLIQIRDIYQRTCREGDTFNQAYGARAGTWTPNNSIESILGNTFVWQPPVFVGTGGSYENITTLSFEGSTNPMDQSWSKQIFVYVREGLQVTRLVDSTAGPSDNFADLVKYLLDATARVDDTFIDTTQLAIAANFTEANKFFFNGSLTQSQNLNDWIDKTSYNFLLRAVRVNGKIALNPRLPYNTDYTIKTTPITPEYTFTEDHVLPDGFEIQYVGIQDRQPFCAVVLWRQQPETDFGLVRSTEVRYSGEATNGPFIQRDMSNYCTTEDHAIKVGVYSLACRKHITHHLRIRVREGIYNSIITVGDIVRVRLRRETSEGNLTYHDYLYEVERINKPPEAFVEFDLTHFPIDSEGRSLIALAVANAQGRSRNIEVGRGELNCDVRPSFSTSTVGTASSTPNNAPADADTRYDLPADPGPSPGPRTQAGQAGAPTPPSPVSNPADPLDQPLSAEDNSVKLNGTLIDSQSFPGPGDSLSVDESAAGCDNGRVCWYRVDKQTGEKTLVQCQTEAISGSFSLSVTTADIGYYIEAYGQCPDPSSPDGFGPETRFGRTQAVEPDFSSYGFVRWQGYRYHKTGRSDLRTGPWLPISSGSFATVGGISNGVQWYEESDANGYFTGTFGNGSDQPWRTTVYAIRAREGYFGTHYIGVEGINAGRFPGQLPAGFAGGQFGTLQETALEPGDMLRGTTGKWQFSNDLSPTKTVALEWVGRNYIPSGSTFSNADFLFDLPFNPNV